MTDPSLELRVTRGGEPTPEQTAAMVLALAAVRPEPATSQDTAGWQRAAIHEGVGAAAATSAENLADLWLRGGR